MFQLPVSFTDPIVILYNIGIIALFALWFIQDRIPVLKRIITEGNLKNWYVFSSLWFIFSIIANFFFLQSDVDDAVISGAVAFVNGHNVYAGPCNPGTCYVVHLLPSGPVLGLYHYFPSDLLIYSFIYYIYRPLLSIFPFLRDSWFFIANVIFLFIGYLFVRKILDHVEDRRLIPIYVFVTCFFLFSNSSLLVMYFTIGFYCLKKLSMKKLGITAYVLSAGVKYITGLILFVQFVEEGMKVKSIEDLKFLIPYIVGSIVMLIIILPFGLGNMINATILYQVGPQRSQVAGIYGPILIEIILLFNILNLFTYIFIISIVVSIVLAFKIGKTTYERQMILCFLFMLILPFYGTELLIVPLLLWMFKLFGVEYNVNNGSTNF